MVKNYTYLDLETHNAGAEYGMNPREFIRLGQFCINDGPVVLTTDYDEILEVARSADFLVTHNGLSSDMKWLFGKDSIEAYEMARDRRVIDTFYLANLLVPAPERFKMRSGRLAVESTDPVGHTMLWLGLDNLAFQLGLSGKMGDLKELAKKYQPEGTKVADYDYGLIPLDDPDFLTYAKQDVLTLRELTQKLFQMVREQNYPGEYIWREMHALTAIVCQMSLNGINVDAEFAENRIAKQEERKIVLMQELVEKYDFPTEGKSPWASAKGKEATLKAMADYGFTPENTPEWPRTPKNAPKLGGKDLLLFAEGTEAEDFVRTLGELKGQRSTAQLVLDNLEPDGRVHPDITALQRSGRFSFTRPGVTIFGERTEELKQDKAIFRAGPGKVMAGFDYSNADARAMAALSGDHEYAVRFAEDDEGNLLHDGHNLSGEAVFGKVVYYGGVSEEENPKPPLRPVAKVYSHASNYGVGAYKLAVQLNMACKQLGIDLFFWASAGKNKDGTYKAKPIAVPDAYRKYVSPNDTLTGEPLPDTMFLTRDMIDRAAEAYPFLARFKHEAYKEAEANGYVTNAWGRRIYVHKSSAYTGGPAAYGQNATSEMMKDSILRLCERGEYYIRALRAIIHDELLMEFDEATIERDIAVVKECMEVDFDPKTRVGFPIKFPVGHGYGKTWYHAGH